MNASILCNGGGGITLSLTKGVNIRATGHLAKCDSPTKEKCIFLGCVCMCGSAEDCRTEVLTVQVQR